MLDIFIAPAETGSASAEYPVQLSLDGSLHAFFSRYFSRARLSGDASSFLSLYGCCELSGYQIVRLRQEMEEARQDLGGRSPRFRVLCGWGGAKKTEVSEVWADVDRDEACSTAEELIRICEEAKSKGLNLIGIGD